MATALQPAEPSPIVGTLATEVADGITVRKLLVMGAALISLFIDQSFSGVFGTIAPYATGTLGASTDEFTWATIDYNACYYTLILLTPWLVGRFGRRSVFAAGHVFFGLTSIALSTTTNVDFFLAGRAVQGIAQGTFFVCSVATVLTLFPPKYRGYAFAIFSVTSLSAAASGAFIGGWFIDHTYWQNVFGLYALMAIVAGVIVALLLEAPPGNDGVKEDWIGVALAFVAFFGYNYVTQYGERRDWLWDGWIDFWSVAATLSLAAFVLWELRLRDRAFIRLRLFKIRNLALGSILGFSLGAPLFGANEFLSYAQTILGYPPSTAGALLTLRIVAIVFVAPAAVLLVNADKIDVKVPVILGFTLVPVSYIMLALTTTFESNVGTFTLALILSGAGFACLFSPIANVTIRSLPPVFSSQGIAIFKMVLLLGGSIAAALLQVLFDHDSTSYATLLTGRADLQHLAGIGATHLPPGFGSYVASQAAVLAFADNSKWIALASLVTVPLVFFLEKPKS